MDDKQEVISVRNKIQKERNEYRSKMQALRDELRQYKSEIHCSKCRYCMTEAWFDRLVCAKPRKNRKICRNMDEIPSIWASDIYAKALACPLYEEDGKQKRDFLDLPEDVRSYWEELHINYLNQIGVPVNENNMNYFRTENRRMKLYIEKKNEGGKSDDVQML